MQTSTTQAAPAVTEIPYEAALARIENGDLLAWKWRAYGLWARHVWDVWTHVGIALWVHGRLCVVEAAWPRVRIVPVDHFQDVFWVPTYALWGTVQSEYAMLQLGDNYSIWDCVIGYGGMPVDDYREQCAELAIRIANHSTVDLGDRATPGACVRAALSVPGADLHHAYIPRTYHRTHAYEPYHRPSDHPPMHHHERPSLCEKTSPPP